MAPRAKEFDLDILPTAIPNVFDQAQVSAANHKKNCVALFKFQNGSAAVTETSGRGTVLAGEKLFTSIFLDMLNRVLPVKKGNQTADRVIRFIATYIKFLYEKADESGDEENFTSRFVSHILKHLLKGFQAKNKDVRFRCVSAVSEIISGLGEIDQDMYKELRTCLVDRLLDKEPLVRVHTVASLSKLAMSEDPDDLDEDEEPLLKHLKNSLLSDPAPEVRRAALIHIPFTPKTLPYLLTRARDVDAVTRKLLYTVVLTRLEHPKQLTISQREQVVIQGLGDREEAVRAAAAKLLGSWLDTCDGNLVEFLQLFDVRTTEITLDALKSIFVTRAELVREIEFNEQFWSDLRPETALLVRAFVEHCIEKGDNAQLESALPVVTALAFYIQRQYNSLLEKMQLVEEMGSYSQSREGSVVDEREEDSANVEFVIVELLSLATHLDYSDEIGRRKMFEVIRSMLAHPELPEPLIKPAVSVLSAMSSNERDLIRIIVEVINELRDSINGLAEEQYLNDGATVTDDESMITARPSVMRRSQTRREVHELTPEEKAQADITDLRCLYLCVAVLERINVSYEENSTLEGVLADLIIPCVKRKELLLRETGLVALGLCCLIAKSMALSSFQLFLSQVKSAPESLRIKVLQVIFDILMTYEHDILNSADGIGQRVIAFIMQVLEAEESKSVQALICLGISKLVLFGLVTDERVLTSLVLAYVSPASADNQELRQCLSYFLPAYCYSSPTNQRRMQSTFITTYDLVRRVYEDMDDDQDMITPLQFGQLFLDWTDYTKVIEVPGMTDEVVDGHAILAFDIIRTLYDDERTGDDKKTLTQLLSKLVLPPTASQRTLYAVYFLSSNLQEICPLTDPASSRAFSRFQTQFSKQYAESLSGYSEETLFNDENGAYDELFEFVGISKPRQRGFEPPTIEAKRGRNAKARETSVATEVETADEEEEEVSVDVKKKGDRRRVAAEHDESATEKDSTASSSSEPEPDTPPARKAPTNTRTNGRSKKTAPPRSPTPPSASSASEAESRAVSPTPEPTPIPSTPPRKTAAKRLHTPSKTPSMPSPAHKRPNRARQTARSTNAKNGKKNDKNASEPEAAPRRSARSKAVVSTKPPPKLRAPASTRAGTAKSRKNAVPAPPSEPSENEDEDEEEDAVPSDSSITARIARPRVNRNPPAELEEKVGWDSSSEP